jgi:ABC-type glycerol-3-phosphate transport system substrate-binding protein
VDQNITENLTISVSAFDSENWIIDKLMEGFQEKYHNVTFTKDPVSGNLISTMMGYWRSETMPDVFLLTNIEMLNLAKAEVVLNLKPYIAAETENGSFDESDYNEAFWKLGQLNFDGDQMMVPRTSDQVVCHVNKKILRDAGLSQANMDKIKNGWSWVDFMDVLRELRSKNVGGVDSWLNWEAVFNPIFESLGVKYFNFDRTPAIKSDQTSAALELMKELYALNGDNYSAGFESGKAAFMFHSMPVSLAVKSLKAVYAAAWEDDFYDVATFPAVDPENPKVGAGLSGYAISSTSAKRDLAWKFLKYVISREGQNKIAEAGMNFPPIRNDMSDPAANKWGEGYESYNMSAVSWASANAYIAPTTFVLIKPGRSTDLVDAVKTMINNYCGEGYTAQRALQKGYDGLEYWLEN